MKAEDLSINLTICVVKVTGVSSVAMGTGTVEGGTLTHTACSIVAWITAAGVNSTETKGELN